MTPRGTRFQGRYFPCSLGKGGVSTTKREGDGATPAGIHRIEAMLFRVDRIPQPAPWAQAIGLGDLWSDDEKDSAYNQLVKAPYPCSHEKLRRADPLYDLVLITNWNWPVAAPGKGSAIFVHQWRRPGYPTEGCVAFRREHLHWIAQRIVPGTRLIIPAV